MDVSESMTVIMTARKKDAVIAIVMKETLMIIETEM